MSFGGGNKGSRDQIRHQNEQIRKKFEYDKKNYEYQWGIDANTINEDGLKSLRKACQWQSAMETCGSGLLWIP